MKILIQVALAGIILMGSVLYISSTTHDYKIVDSGEDDEPDPISGFVRDFSIVGLLEKEALRIKEEKDVAELELYRANERNKIKEQELAEQREVERERKAASITRGGVNKGVFTATAYDLTVASCGKNESHPAYGITASGVSLKGETLESARAIAVDPKVIKLGSKVQLEFLDEGYQHLNSTYIAVDTGGAIKGNKIDIFHGSGDVKQEVKNFGKRKVKVTALPND